MSEAARTPMRRCYERPLRRISARPMPRSRSRLRASSGRPMGARCRRCVGPTCRTTMKVGADNHPPHTAGSLAAQQLQIRPSCARQHARSDAGARLLRTGCQPGRRAAPFHLLALPARGRLAGSDDSEPSSRPESAAAGGRPAERATTSCGGDASPRPAGPDLRCAERRHLGDQTGRRSAGVGHRR